MSAPLMRAGIYRLQNFDFSSVIPIQKCCKDNQLYSVGNRKCVSHHFNSSLSNSDVRLDPSKFDVYYGFPCSYPDYRYSVTNSSWIQNFSQNGSLVLHSSNKGPTYNLEWGQYCLDLEKGSFKLNPLLISCDQLLPAMPVNPGFLIFYSVSLLLAFITVSIFLAIPELRAKVKDKCFICYSISFIFWMIIQGDVWGLNEFSVLRNLSVDAAYGLECVSCMVTFSWMNVMCIHLWRTVTTVSSISPRCFYVYTLYALGLPLTCRSLFFIDHLISGIDKFSYREANGGLFSNPVLLYWFNVSMIQLFINIGIILHVGFIIWRQKRRWRSEDHVGIKHLRQQQSMVSQAFRLSTISHLEWIYVFIILYLRIEGIVFVCQQLIFWVKVCPGYYIFIIHVCCNKQVVSLLRGRFSKNVNAGASLSSSLKEINFIGRNPPSLTQTGG